MDIHHILFTIAYALIIVGLILLAPCFLKGCCAKAQTKAQAAHASGGTKVCGMVSWACFMAGFILSIISVWLS